MLPVTWRNRCISRARGRGIQVIDVTGTSVSAQIGNASGQL
jgi:hypothetical protein